MRICSHHDQVSFDDAGGVEPNFYYEVGAAVSSAPYTNEKLRGFIANSGNVAIDGCTAEVDEHEVKASGALRGVSEAAPNNAPLSGHSLMFETGTCASGLLLVSKPDDVNVF